MTTASTPHAHAYRPTEAKYKGGAEEKFITYDLDQATRGGGTATYPKVKRVYVSGDMTNWEVGTFRKRSGKRVHGVKIDYAQTRAGYHRGGYTARRGGTTYEVKPTDVEPSTSRFSQIVEVPEAAHSIQFHDRGLPERYREALQDVQ